MFQLIFIIVLICFFCVVHSQNIRCTTRGAVRYISIVYCHLRTHVAKVREFCLDWEPDGRAARQKGRCLLSIVCRSEMDSTGWDNASALGVAEVNIGVWIIPWHTNRCKPWLFHSDSCTSRVKDKRPTGLGDCWWRARLLSVLCATWIVPSKRIQTTQTEVAFFNLLPIASCSRGGKEG